jgi:AcrR family transcriptional regulator
MSSSVRAKGHIDSRTVGKTIVFTAFGYDGARVDDIAKRAAVNKRMIYVYFGDKEGLYHEVLKTAFARILKRIKLPSGADPRASLQAWIVDYFSFLAQHPELVRLVDWEVLADGAQSVSTVQEVALQEIQELTALLDRGIELGQFRRDTKPVRVLMVIHALCFGILSRKRLWNSLWQLDLSQTDTAASVAKYVTEIVLNGIGVANVKKPTICAKEIAL